MSFCYRYRKVIFICVLVLVVCSCSFYFYFGFGRKKVNKSKSLVLSSNKSQDSIVKSSLKKKEKKNDSSIDQYYKVDIKGQVANPGLYSLKKSSRVFDVINLSGGLLDNADTSVINLSKKIQDEMVIIIYSKDEVNNFTLTMEKMEKKSEGCVNPNGDNGIKNDACIDSGDLNLDDKSVGDASGSKVNINSATLDQFMTLNGIGESKALKIIKYREEHGDFKSIEDIKNVDGIGDSLYDKIKENLTL